MSIFEEVADQVLELGVNAIGYDANGCLISGNGGDVFTRWNSDCEHEVLKAFAIFGIYPSFEAWMLEEDLFN